MEPISVQVLVDQLFKTHRHPEGREYTYQEVVTKLKALGISIDYTTLSKVRSGDIANPGRRVLLGLCQFFRVPASYFFPELEALAPQAETPTPEEQLHAAFRSMGVPPDVQEHLIGVARTFKKPSKD
jgi:transcriptional regulator with XRE-family HTH domain